jgi:N-methylhydantoinase A
VFDGAHLEAGSEVEGPAIIEYADSEIIVPPRMTARTDKARNVVLSAPVLA